MSGMYSGEKEYVEFSDGLFPEGDVGVAAEMVREIAEEIQREARQGDILGDGELLPDGGAGERRAS